MGARCDSSGQLVESNGANKLRAQPMAGQPPPAPPGAAERTIVTADQGQDWAHARRSSSSFSLCSFLSSALRPCRRATSGTSSLPIPRPFNSTLTVPLGPPAVIERHDRVVGNGYDRAADHRVPPGARRMQLGDLLGPCQLPRTDAPGHQGAGAHGERAVTLLAHRHDLPLPFGETRKVGHIGEDVLGPAGGLDALHDRSHLASFVHISSPLPARRIAANAAPPAAPHDPLPPATNTRTTITLLIPESVSET